MNNSSYLYHNTLVSLCERVCIHRILLITSVTDAVHVFTGELILQHCYHYSHIHNITAVIDINAFQIHLLKFTASDEI